MYDFKKKQTNVTQLNNYMLAKTLSMFEYYNLPDTIPYRELEKLLQTKGYAFITEHNGELYAFTGGLGGVLDTYGNPTEIIISNPYLNLNKTFNIEKDGVLIRNDDLMIGLIPLFDKTHSLLVENDINMILHGYNSRLTTLISAPDDKTKESAESYLSKVIGGELGIIGDNTMFDGIKVHNGNSNNSNPITNLIEYQQYVKATMYNEVGLSANFNMKRERLNSQEVDQGNDALFPYVYNMMKCRLKGIEKLNEKYNQKIDIDFGSVWHVNNKEFIDDINQSEAPQSVTGETQGDPQGETTEPLNEELETNESDQDQSKINTGDATKSNPQNSTEENTGDETTGETIEDPERKPSESETASTSESSKNDDAERERATETKTEQATNAEDTNDSPKGEKKGELNETENDKENEPKNEPKNEPLKDEENERKGSKKKKKILRRELLKKRKGVK